jgi:hypothetical protein|tara:strand:+ start:173 stop:325 length:153 start_codon:yes stop_codon:yes gene_type:complete
MLQGAGMSALRLAINFERAYLFQQCFVVCAKRGPDSAAIHACYKENLSTD